MTLAKKREDLNACKLQRDIFKNAVILPVEA